jgi:cytochrome c-type biogenesis protein CcmH
MSNQAALLVLCVVVLAACDRNVEPFVPGEEPRQPDLSKIFPAGAERAARNAGPPGIPDAAPPSPQGGRGMDATADAPPIRGLIEVAPELAGQVPSGGVLFLIARSGPGGPPLAVVRVAEPSFPLSFEIGPANRMIRTIPFVGELRLTARLDQDGDAASRTPGDLHGAAEGAHRPGATGVTITLSEVL